ncbi:MAG: phospholipid/cholesterol/gamma-HCH transport system substrate-binding protein [Solirubrobacteraceae bacterium]|jgi:virulence factor Mce-like protein|nr:phospholipid/cholesterol/gamma-HCH transport system substrate-binding protein [Solirubrobacteraceae bacterium]
METRAPTVGAIMAAVLFALSCFGATLFVWRSFGGPTPLAPQGYRFHVSFDQAATLTPNADVRISGIPVGKVVRVRPQGLRTDAVIELQRRYAPLPRDARAILRSKTLLGETFVELSPGSPGAPKLRDGATLAVRQVADTQQLDEVLSAFDARTRESFRNLLSSLSDSLRGRGGATSDALGNAGVATSELGDVALVLDSQRPAVTRLVRDTGRVLRALGRRDADLRTLVVAGDQVLGATAARDRELAATVRALPPFLAELRATLAVAEATALEAAPTLRTLRPVVPFLRPGLIEASRLAPELERLFRGLRPVQIAARTGLPALTRIVDASPALLDVVDRAARDLIPVLEFLNLYRRDIVAAFANIAASTNSSTPGPDGTPQHYLRTLVPLNSEGPMGQAQRLASNRHNPYIAPGSQADYLRGGLRAFDCRNLSNPQTVPIPPPGTGAPPCLVQAPWRFQNRTRAFPHVERQSP